jgi:hypothetical protein
MISPEVKKLFFDIDRAGDLIVTFVGRKTRDEFISDIIQQDLPLLISDVKRTLNP